MIARRSALAAILGAVAAACAGSPAAGPKAPPLPELHLDPLTDLVAAAGLVWMVTARPQEVMATPTLASVVGAAAPDAALDAAARRLGGADVRQAEELVVVGLQSATMVLARLPVAPASVEQAFAKRAAQVEGRAEDRGVVRVWGTVGQEREQVALFGSRGLGVEVGAFGPLQTAAYFAEWRLKRSPPALRAEPLAGLLERLGPAPVRAFAPGPFDVERVAGLLRAATAVGAAARATDRPRPGALALKLVLTGAWGADARAAAERLEAYFRLLGEDPLGRLTGLDRPLQGPVATGEPDGLALDVTLDSVSLCQGVRAIAGAPLAEIMAL